MKRILSLTFTYALSICMAMIAVACKPPLAQPTPTPPAGMTFAPPTASPTTTATSVPPTSTPTQTPTPSSADRARAFAEPILAAITDLPPDFEDDFSAADRGWSTWIGKMGRPGDFAIEEGVARFRLEQAELAMEHEALFQEDFVLQLDARLAAGDATSRTRVEFRVAHPGTGGLKIELLSEPGRWIFEWWDWDTGQFEQVEGRGNVSLPGETTQITIVARGPEVAIYLNDAPVIYAEKADLDVIGTAYMMCHSLSETACTCEFDNVRLWNLEAASQLPPAEATPTPVPISDSTLYGCQPGERLLTRCQRTCWWKAEASIWINRGQAETRGLTTSWCAVSNPIPGPAANSAIPVGRTVAT